MNFFARNRQRIQMLLAFALFHVCMAVALYALVTGWWFGGSIFRLISAIAILPAWIMPCWMTPATVELLLFGLFARPEDPTSQLYNELAMERQVHNLKSAFAISAVWLVLVAIPGTWIFLLGAPESWWIKLLGAFAACCCTPILLRVLSKLWQRFAFEVEQAEVFFKAVVCLEVRRFSELGVMFKPTPNQSRRKRKGARPAKQFEYNSA